MTTKVKGELVNYCRCSFCPVCDVLTMTDGDEECPECGTNVEYAQDGCGGDCWDYMVDDITWQLDEWMTGNDIDAFAIYGSGMGWTRSSGHTGRLTAAEELIEAMSIDTMWNIQWEVDGPKFTMVRKSHDEYGAYFELRPWNEGDDE